MAAEADAGADAPAPVPTVSITIAVATANLLSPDEDAIAALSTFARVSVLGNSAQSLWWPMTPPDTVADGEPTGSCLSKPGVGPVPQWGYAQPCKPLPLADDALTDLANSQLRVEVVAGATSSPTEGTVVGSFTVALEDLLFGTIDEEFELHDFGEGFADLEGSTVHVEIAAPEELVAHTLGGRLLSLTDAKSRGLPYQWLLGNSGNNPDVADEGATLEDVPDILAMVNDPAQNSARFQLTVEVPPGDGPFSRPLATVVVGAGGGPSDAADGEAKGAEGDESKGDADAADVEVVTKQRATAGRADGTLRYAVARAARTSRASLIDDSKEAGGEESKTYAWQIEWPDINVFLSKSAVAQLKDEINAGSGLHIVVRRIKCTPLEEGEPEVGLGGVKPGLEDFLARGQLTVLVDELLVPGTQYVDCDEALAPMAVSEDEMAAAKEAAAKAAAEAEAAAAAASKGKKGKKPAKKGKKGKEPPPAEEEAVADATPHLTGATARMSFTLQVNEALVIRPPTPPPPELTPADLIPARPKPPAGPPGVAASADFRQQVTELAHRVAQEFVVVCRQLAEEEGSIAHTTPEMRRRALLQHLNEGGHYREMKEKLKRHVVRIVRERFQKTEEIQDAHARDVFVSELYTYLMGQVHRAINRAFAKAAAGEAEAGPGAESGVPVSPTKTLTTLLSSTVKVDVAEEKGNGTPEESPGARLRRMADEAEFLGQFERAAKHHQDRVAKSELAAASGKSGAYEVDVWRDYAMFCLRMGDVPKAAECLRECVGIDSRDVPVLLALASVLCVQGQYDRAAVMAKGAINVLDPVVEEAEEGKEAPRPATPPPNDQVSGNDLCVAFTVLSVALERDEESKKAGTAVLDAVAAAKRQQPGADAATAYLLSSRYLLTLRLTSLAEYTLRLARSVMLDSRPPQEQRVELLVLEARLFEYGEDRTRQEERLDEVQDLDSSCTEAWAMRGDAMLAAGRITDARAAFELAVGDWARADGAASDPALLMKLARIYLDQHVAGVDGPSADGPSLGASAKEVYLRAARLCNWGAAWCGAGEAALRIGDRDEAEAALCEANTRDNHNAEVWGWLCLLCVTATPLRETEAAQALDQALKLRLRSAPLLQEIGARYLELGKNKVAEGVLRRSLAAAGAEPHTQRLLGDALANQNQAEQAIAAYEAVLASTDEATDRAAATSGLEAMRALIA